MVQPANPVPFRRGARGLLLLTNLAHPMNPGYRARGAADEIAVLAAIARAAALAGPAATRLLWKPHPVIDNLPAGEAARLRQQARALVFEELPHGPPIVGQAAKVRWMLSTPSTVAVDLLGEGVLSTVVCLASQTDDTAPTMLPRCAHAAVGPSRLDLPSLLRPGI